MGQLLTHTPVWVWGILVLLVYVGYLQSRAREVKRTTLLILPIGMAALSIHGVWAAFGLTLISLGAWLSGVALAQLINSALHPAAGAACQRETDKVRIPGSWLPLSLMMGIFFTKYFINASLATRFASADNLVFVTACSVLLGLFSGMFIARARQFLRCTSVSVLAA